MTPFFPWTAMELTARRLLALGGMLVMAANVATGEIVKEQFQSGGRKRVCHVLTPKGVTAAEPAPLLLALHGSGQGGRPLVERWSALAREQRFVVAGPDAYVRDYWDPTRDGPDFLRDVVETVASRHPVNRRRVYLFGYSGGGHFALQMAVAESEYFAAAAVYAGALKGKLTNLVTLARREIPITLYAGSADTVVPADSVRRTWLVLQQRGLPAEFHAMPGWDHAYTRFDYRGMQRRIWESLRKHELSSAPVFQPYEVGKPSRHADR